MMQLLLTEKNKGSICLDPEKIDLMKKVEKPQFSLVENKEKPDIFLTNKRMCEIKGC